MSTTPIITDGRAEAPNAGLLSDIVCEDENWPGVVLDSGFHARITAAIGRVLEFERREAVVVSFSNDAAVQALNARYRDQDKPTNVLSFPAIMPAAVAGVAGPGSPGSDDTAVHLGDIILARETVAREASEQDIEFEHHTAHLIIHGILHLLGYDHQDEHSAEEMEALEIGILADLGIENPYTEELDDAR